MPSHSTSTPNRDGRSPWYQLAAQVHPSWLCTLTQPLRLLPGSQIQCRESAALDKVPGKGVGHEDVVLGYSGDACIVADDTGQGDLGQRLPLLLAEYILVLPPKPARGHHGHCARKSLGW